jgi:uncharacterized membrane protein
VKTTGSGHLRRDSYGPWTVAALFTVSGSTHLARPAIFTRLVPRVLPWPTELVYASGVVELICAVGLWRRDRWAGIAAAVLLVTIWPANLQAAITAQHSDNKAMKALTLVRLPLQIPLIWSALQSGRSRNDDLPPDPRISTSR